MKTVESAPRLLTEERRRRILSMTEKDGRVIVQDLVRTCRVSAVTARADLDALAAAGLVVRSWGGAIRKEDPAYDYPISVKGTLHHAEKTRIGKAAAQLIHPHQTIILDSGSTTAEIAQQIRRRRVYPLAVVTNALNITLELHRIPQMTLIMLGGILRQTSDSMVGPQAERVLRELNADHLFLGVDALDPETGMSTPDILEAQLNALMIDVSREVTIVADSSKLGRRSLSVIGPVERAQRLITDTAADPAMVAAIRARGVEVVLV